jgi:16S rRNA processing protein RimM
MTVGQNERAQAGVEGEWICVGALGAPHGVRGDMRLKSFTEQPAAIFKFVDIRLGADGAAVALVKKGKAKDGFIIHITGIDTPEDASNMKTKQLYVSRENFGAAAEDEFYLADLIGLRAHDLAGTEIGVVSSFDNFGAEDLLELVLHEAVKGLGRHIFVPFRKSLVPTIDLDAGIAVIDFAGWQATQTSERDMDAGEDDSQLIEDKGEK